MRTRTWTLLGLGGLLTAAVVIGLYLPSRAGAVGSEATAGLGAAAGLRSAAMGTVWPLPGPAQLTRLQVDLYELRCTSEQLARLDLMEIGKDDDGGRPMTASAAVVLERLKALGEASLAVRYDSFVDLRTGARITSGQRVPSVGDVSISSGGVVVPSVRYESVGFLTSIQGVWFDETQPNLAEISFGVTSSDLADSAVSVANLETGPLSLPIFDQFDSSQRLVVRSGLPVLLACNDLSGPVHADGRMKVLVARLVATRLIE